ncbi:MAG TPA: hypothetical protein ENI80_06530 [Acidiferrobacteraceae bacterium]|nr:hypothetical protein [Acidiferrobacteraceae bacterium]
MSQDSSIQVVDNFEGARVGSTRIDGSDLWLALRHEDPVRVDWKIHDYRLHFTFGIKSVSPHKISVRIRVGDGDRNNLPYDSPLIFSSNDPLGTYMPLSVNGASDEYQRYDFDVEIEPGETLYIANCLPRPLSKLVPVLNRIAQLGGAERVVYGKSLEGRDLIAYSFRETGVDRPCVLIASGTHPPEPDTLVTEALIEYLGDEGSSQLRDVFDFVVVPIQNPDGYAHGTQAGNAAGINFYWDFRHKDVKRCPEAVALYNFVGQICPVLYFDFHAYTFQRRKFASPYCKPLNRYRGQKVRKAVQAMDMAIQSGVSDNKAITGFVAYAPSTLGEKLTRRFNTISYAKYHVHLKDGEQRCREHGVSAVEAACKSMLEQGLDKASMVLVRPYGNVPKELFGEMRRQLQVYWEGWAHPTLYRNYKRYIKSRFVPRQSMDTVC